MGLFVPARAAPCGRSGIGGEAALFRRATGSGQNVLGPGGQQHTARHRDDSGAAPAALPQNQIAARVPAKGEFHLVAERRLLRGRVRRLQNRCEHAPVQMPDAGQGRQGQIFLPAQLRRVGHDLQGAAAADTLMRAERRHGVRGRAQHVQQVGLHKAGLAPDDPRADNLPRQRAAHKDRRAASTDFAVVACLRQAGDAASVVGQAVHCQGEDFAHGGKVAAPGRFCQGHAAGFVRHSGREKRPDEKDRGPGLDIFRSIGQICLSLFGG